MCTTAEYTLSAIIIAHAHREEGPHVLAWKKGSVAKDKLFLMLLCECYTLVEKRRRFSESNGMIIQLR